MSGVLRGNCCETCRNIFLKTPMKQFTKKNSLTRHTFSERLQQLLINKENIYKLQMTLGLFCMNYNTYMYLQEQLKIQVTASGEQICFSFMVNVEKNKIRITK